MKDLSDNLYSIAVDFRDALKHSIATHILDAGEDAAFAGDWLGHKNIQNTVICARFSTGTRDARAPQVVCQPRGDMNERRAGRRNQQEARDQDGSMLATRL